MRCRFVCFAFVCIAVLGVQVAGSAQLVPIAPLSVDFHASFNALYVDLTTSTGLLGSLIKDEQQKAVLSGGLNPTTGDINGQLDLVNMTYTGNNMLDADYELAIITAVMHKDAAWTVNGLTAAGMVDDWNFNTNHWLTDDFLALNNLYSFLVSALPAAGPLLPHLFAILTGFVTLGDGTLGTVGSDGKINPPGTGSVGFVQALYSVIPSTYLMGKSFVPSHFRAHPTLCKDGNADGDIMANGNPGTNYLEYKWKLAAKSPAAYLSAVLDPQQIPQPCCSEPFDTDNDGLTDDYEQETIYPTGHTTNWQVADTDGDGVKDGDEVLVWGTDPTDPSDKPALPVSGYTGLAMLAGLLGLAGLSMALRKA